MIDAFLAGEKQDIFGLRENFRQKISTFLLGKGYFCV
jgi:hypothetical protein